MDIYTWRLRRFWLKPKVFWQLLLTNYLDSVASCRYLCLGSCIFLRILKVASRNLALADTLRCKIYRRFDPLCRSSLRQMPPEFCDIILIWGLLRLYSTAGVVALQHPSNYSSSHGASHLCCRQSVFVAYQGKTRVLLESYSPPKSLGRHWTSIEGL